MQNASFIGIDSIVEKVSHSADLIRLRYLNMIKGRIKSSPSKKGVMCVKCRCEENNFDVLVSQDDIERVYNRFAKKCISCGQPIKISFKFN